MGNLDSMTSTGLSELTIVIPTVSRPLFILRQHEYWRDTDARIVILDGASSPISIPSSLRSPNIQYIHTGTRLTERLATASQYVSTKYCALLPDDEFFLVSGLRAAIRRLEEDAAIIGCVGRNLYFFVDQQRFLVRDAYRYYKPFPATAQTVEARLDADVAPNKTHGCSYGVFRSLNWSQIFSRSYGEEFSSGYVYERLTNLYRTVLGRTEILEDLLWMRSMENPPIVSADIPRVGGRDFVSWSQNPAFAGEVARYRSIALNIIRSGGISDAKASSFEERFFVGGVYRQATKEARNAKSWTRRLGDIALNRTPGWLRLWAKRFLPNRLVSFTGWQGFDLDTMCDSLILRGTRFSRPELDRVAELSMKLHHQANQQKVAYHVG
jgi:glycosyltransferase domain-containing protein